MLQFKLNGGEGVHQGRTGANSDEFLRRLSKGASTPDLIVMEFRNGCGQMDLASACVLRPLNHLVLDFEVEVDGRMNEQRSKGGILERKWWRGLTVRGGVRTGNINGT